jgi:hypothetical protein
VIGALAIQHRTSQRAEFRTLTMSGAPDPSGAKRAPCSAIDFTKK